MSRRHPRSNFQHKSNRRKHVSKRDKGLCQYCGQPGDTLDHMIPKCRGGATTRWNRVVACVRCNSTKGDLTPLEFFWGVDRNVVRRVCPV